MGMGRKAAVGALAVAAAATGIWVLSDYRQWRLIGSQTVPPTWRGWATARLGRRGGVGAAPAATGEAAAGEADVAAQKTSP